MQYKYNTPEEAIVSLENAYTSKDFDKVMYSKDFVTEAKLVLEQKSYEITTELVEEVAELLRLSLSKSLQENGYPNFNSARREFSDLQQFKDNVFFLEERKIF